MVKYELKFKVKGFPWKLFDTYKNKNDPALKKYHDMIKVSKFNSGVKVIKVETIRTEVNIKD